MCVAANFRLGEEDSDAWNIVEGKFPFEKNSQLSNTNPLPHAVLLVLQSARFPSKRTTVRLIDQASTFLEHSTVYNNCKQQSSQNVMVRCARISRSCFLSLSLYIYIYVYIYVFLYFKKTTAPRVHCSCIA